jgi:triacylglycerol lipase
VEIGSGHPGSCGDAGGDPRHCGNSRSASGRGASVQAIGGDIRADDPLYRCRERAGRRDPSRHRGSAEFWKNQIPSLSRHHRVIAIDLLGFGDSAKPLIGYRIQTWVDFVGEFLQVKQIDHFTLVGESLGGWIAAQYVVQSLAATNDGELHIPTPDRLVLTDGGGIKPDGPQLAGMVNPSSVEDTRRALRAAYHDPKYASLAAARCAFAGKLAVGNGVALDSMAANLGKSNEYLDQAQLASIRIPTLVVWGDDDRVVPIAHGHALARGIPGAKMVIIEGCGHVPPAEKPDEYLRALETFID